MSKREKLIERFKSQPNDFTWNEVARLLGYYGYEPISGSGSRVKFINQSSGHKISLHKPHPKEILLSYQIKLVYESLEKEGLI